MDDPSRSALRVAGVVGALLLSACGGDDAVADATVGDGGAVDGARGDGASSDAAFDDGSTITPSDGSLDAPTDAAMPDAGDGEDAAVDAAVDAGPALMSCDGRPHGTMEMRECYAAPRAPPGGACSSTTQTRTCDDGTWTPDWPPCDWFACGPGSALYIDRIGTATTGESTYDGAVDAAGYAYVVAGNVGGRRGVHLHAFGSDGTRRWMRTAGGVTSSDEALDVATDASGNVFITGYADSSTINLGGSDLVEVPGDGMGVVVASYTRDNAHRWSLRVPGSGRGNAIATGATGKVYVGGAAFGEIALEGTRITVPGTGAGFVVRYSNLGVVEWSRFVGSWVFGVGADAAGNVFVGGTFDGTVDFGGMSRTGPGTFVASYRPDGTLRWVRDILGTATVVALAVDPSTGRVAIGGSFRGTVDFGGGPVTASTGGSDRDPFVVVYGNDGTFGLAKNIDAGGASSTNDVAFDAAGNLYAVGEMQGGFDFATETRYSLSGRVRIFWVSYDGAGMHRWSRIVGGTLTEERALGVGVGDYVLVTGQIDGMFGVDGQVTGGWVQDGLVLALAR